MWTETLVLDDRRGHHMVAGARTPFARVTVLNEIERDVNGLRVSRWAGDELLRITIGRDGEGYCQAMVEHLASRVRVRFDMEKR